MELLSFLRKKLKVDDKITERLKLVTASQEPFITSEPETNSATSKTRQSFIPDEEERLQIAREHAKIVQRTALPKSPTRTK